MEPVKNKLISFNLPLAIIVIIIFLILFCIGFFRLEIDTDLVDSLPQKDTAIRGAVYIFKNHPIQDQIIIDVGLETDNPDLLVDVGLTIEDKLMDSGLFETVGMKDFQSLIPDLVFHILENLPFLFSEKELEEKVKPLLTPLAIHKQINNHYNNLHSMNGIGVAELITKDPFGLKDFVLARLSSLAPSANARIYKEKLISTDGKHLFLMARLNQSGTDTIFGRKLTDLIKTISDDVMRKYSEEGNRITLSPVGGYRSALDNEVIIRKDVQKALVFTTLGIIILLLFAFSRPWIGLLSFVPAICGIVMAYFVYSLLYESISIMVIGFGGAIISITVDHGIAYLLFLDRPNVSTKGKEASREIWAIGLIAAMTSVGAFGTLIISGFPVLEQLGQFTALGIFFSFIFVHTVFPKIFPEIPPATIEKSFFSRRITKLASSGKKGAFAAFIFVIVMAFFAKPDFNVDLSAMNTVSRDTLAAEKLLEDVWGNIFSKIYLMIECENIEALQEKGDGLLEKMARDINAGYLASGFVPSMIFPGKNLRASNYNAWNNFWNKDRVADIKHSLTKSGEEKGFTADAFSPFYTIISSQILYNESESIPERFWGLLGISELSGKNDKKGMKQFLTFSTGDIYDAERFYGDYGSFGRVFDPELFTEKFGKLLFSTFVKLMVIIGISVTILLFFFFLDLKLTLVALLPVIFALISTLGTLKLIGRPLDIPCLMLSIIVMGMGIDYSLFFVRSYQRYGYADHPSFNVIRMAIFMASASTIIGFGVLCMADHSVLKSAGLASLFGISYSLIGAFVILPPLLEKMFQVEEDSCCMSESTSECIIERYHQMEAYIRMFVRFKLRLDPMFTELPKLIDQNLYIKTIIDIGSGYGIPGCWFLERFRGARLYGIEPDPERVRIASKAVRGRGNIVQGRAPYIPKLENHADLALMLDMEHYLTKDELTITLKRIRDALNCNGRLIVRGALPLKKKIVFTWWIEEIKNRINGLSTFYRPISQMEEIIKNTGFELELTELSGTNGELVWLIAKNKK